MNGSEYEAEVVTMLLAVRNPAANRSLITFGGRANLAHAAVMAAQEYRNVIGRLSRQHIQNRRILSNVLCKL